MLLICYCKTTADDLIWRKLTWEADDLHILKTMIAKGRMPTLLTSSCHSIGIANHTVKLLTPTLRARPLVYTIVSLIYHFRWVHRNPISTIFFCCSMQHKLHKTCSIFSHIYQEMTFSQLFYALCGKAFLDLNWRTLARHKHSLWRLHFLCFGPAIFLWWYLSYKFFCQAGIVILAAIPVLKNSRSIDPQPVFIGCANNLSCSIL